MQHSSDHFSTRPNAQHKARVMREFGGLYMYYHHREINESVLSMYYRDVADLPCEDIIGALETLRRDPKRRTMPLPADVRALIAPEDDTPLAAANQIAGAIVNAIARYGYMRAAMAHENLGDLAWRVVESKGGWSAVCMINANDAAFFAQCRELALSFGAGTKRAMRYKPGHEVKALPAPQNTQEKGLPDPDVQASKAEAKRILESFGVFI